MILILLNLKCTRSFKYSQFKTMLMLYCYAYTHSLKNYGFDFQTKLFRKFIKFVNTYNVMSRYNLMKLNIKKKKNEKEKHKTKSNKLYKIKIKRKHDKNIQQVLNGTCNYFDAVPTD